MNVTKNNKVTVIVAVIVAMILAFTSSGFNSIYNANAYTSARSYFKYDASDGGYFGFYTLPQTNLSQIQSVINTDGRTTNTFNNGVVKLIGESNYLGSGFIVDNHVIATAAHCVFNSDYESRIVEDILAFSSNNTVLAHLTPVEVHIPCQYISYKDNGNDQAAKN